MDPFTKKEWYKLIAPSIFATKDFGKTLITKTQGTKIASEYLKGRVVEVSLGDLNKVETSAWRKVKLCIEDVQVSDYMIQDLPLNLDTFLDGQLPTVDVSEEACLSILDASKIQSCSASA